MPDFLESCSSCSPGILNQSSGRNHKNISGWQSVKVGKILLVEDDHDLLVSWMQLNGIHICPIQLRTCEIKTIHFDGRAGFGVRK